MADLSNGPAGANPAGLSQNFYLGIAIVDFGAALLVWIIPAQVNDAGSFGLPPSLAPRALAWVMLAWVMIVCGGVLALQNLRTTRNEAAGLVAKEVAFLLACLLAVAVMLVLMRYLSELIDRPNMGFLMSAPLGVIAFTALHSRAPIWAYAFNAIVAPLMIVAGFWWGLELPLP